MKRKWLGQYSYYGRVPINLHDSITEFVIVIDEYTDSKFSGVVEDDMKTGGTKGVGIVNGILKGSKVLFVKKNANSNFNSPRWK